MKTDQELRKMNLNELISYKENLKKDIDSSHIEKIEALISLREAQEVDLYDELKNTVTKPHGGARDGSGRKPTGRKRDKQFNFSLTKDEKAMIETIVEFSKLKNKTKNKSDAIIEIFKYYKTNIEK